MLNLDTMVEVGGKHVSVQELLTIDETDLNAAYATQAARYAYFAVLTDDAEHLYNTLRDVMKQTEAEAFVAYKSDEKYIPKGSRSVSDTLANSLVAVDDLCVEARAEEMSALRDFHLLRSLTRSFQQRADMLQSMGAHLRHEAEMEGMSVREPSDALRRSMRKS